MVARIARANTCSKIKRGKFLLRYFLVELNRCETGSIEKHVFSFTRIVQVGHLKTLGVAFYLTVDRKTVSYTLEQVSKVIHDQGAASLDMLLHADSALYYKFLYSKNETKLVGLTANRFKRRYNTKRSSSRRSSK